MSNIGKKIRMARKSADLTQSELANKIGTTSQMVGSWERGERNPKWKTLQKLAEVLGVPAHFFISEDEVEPEGPEDILIRIDANSKAKQVWKTEIYFESKAERDNFGRKLTESWYLYEWIDAEVELPPDGDLVICAVTGKHGNIEFHGAIELANWIDTEGWILEAYPNIVNPGVTHWMHLPKGPEVKEKSSCEH